MGELRSMNVVLGAIYDPDTINNALRAGPKELQDFLGWLMFGDTDAGHGVVGFSASETSALNVTVTRGGGLIYNSAAASPASKWAWVYSGDSVVKAIGAHHATLARVDLISLTWAQATDTAVSVGYEGGIPASTNTQRGCQATLTVTAGTAHADPWANKAATPANAEPLWYVYVPATSGALVMVDARTHLPGPHYRDGLAPMIHYTNVDTDAVQASVSARKADNADTAWASLQSWDVAEDWPYITRGKGGAGESSADLYPMMALGRTWSKMVPWVGFIQVNAAPAGLSAVRSLTLGNVTYSRSAATANNGDGDLVPIPVDARALEVTAASIIYEVFTAFDGVHVTRSVELIHVAADGTVTVIGSVDLDLTTVPGNPVSLALTMAGTPVIAAGDCLFAAIKISRTGTSTGIVTVQALSVTFKEGRT